MTGGFFSAHLQPSRAHVRRRVVAIAMLVASASTVVLVREDDAQANGGAKHDFRVVPRVGTPTTTFRVAFTAPFRTDGDANDYTLEGIGPTRCAVLFEFTFSPTRRGDKVVMRLTPGDDLLFGSRRRWCLGSYVGVVYHSPDVGDDKLIGWFSFGVGRSPVSLEP